MQILVSTSQYVHACVEQHDCPVRWQKYRYISNNAWEYLDKNNSWVSDIKQNNFKYSTLNSSIKILFLIVLIIIFNSVVARSSYCAESNSTLSYPKDS